MLLVARCKRTSHNWRKAGVRADVVFRSLLRKSSPAARLHSGFMQALGGELVLCHHPLIHEALRTRGLLLWEVPGLTDGFAQVGVKDSAECLVTCAVIQTKHTICWGKFAVPSFRVAIFNAAVAHEGVFVFGAVAEAVRDKPNLSGRMWCLVADFDLHWFACVVVWLAPGWGSKCGFSVWSPIRILPPCPIDTCPRQLLWPPAECSSLPSCLCNCSN